MCARQSKQAEIDRKIAELEQEIIKRTKARQECDDLGQEVLKLRDEKYRLQLEDAGREDVRRKAADIEAFLEELDSRVEEYDESLVRRLIEKITVYDERFTVEFKSGLSVDVAV